MNNKEVKFLYLMQIFSGYARGSYLNCIGWTTLVISNSVATVGQVFIALSITVMLFSPIAGILIDRHLNRNLIVISQSVIVLCMMSLAFFLYYGVGFSVLWLFAAVIIIAAFRVLYRGSFDSIIKGAKKDSEILQTYARSQILHLLATATGMAGTGILIDKFSLSMAFFASGLASIFVLIVAAFLDKGLVKNEVKIISTYWSDFKGGLEIFRNNRLIQMLTLLSATVLPIGQLGNAVMSSFIRDDLGAGSDVYGIVDAGWAVGGMLGAAFLGSKIKNIINEYTEYYMAVMAGVSTIVFSLCIEVFSLTFIHALMGFFVWMCRIIIAGRVIELCTTENVGRTRTYIEVLFGFSSMIMALSPTIIQFDKSSMYFQYWGVFIILSSVILWGWKKSSYHKLYSTRGRPR